MKTMINKEQCAEAQWDNDMPFGPKQTVGISGHYSEAWSGSMRKLSGDAEAGGKQWKTVEDSGRQAEGLEDVRK